MSEKLTAAEILNILIEKNIPVENFAYNDVDYQDLGLGEVEEVCQKGGEGEGETWFSVKYFKYHDVYIRTDGYYQSYYGTEFHQGMGYEVRPQEKVITVYE